MIKDRSIQLYVFDVFFLRLTEEKHEKIAKGKTFESEGEHEGQREKARKQEVHHSRACSLFSSYRLWGNYEKKKIFMEKISYAAMETVKWGGKQQVEFSSARLPLPLYDIDRKNNRKKESVLNAGPKTAIGEPGNNGEKCTDAGGYLFVSSGTCADNGKRKRKNLISGVGLTCTKSQQQTYLHCEHSLLVWFQLIMEEGKGEEKRRERKTNLLYKKFTSSKAAEQKNGRSMIPKLL